MSTIEPKQDSRGRFYRNIGYTEEGSRNQPKILLGSDRVEATARLCRVLQLWRFHADTERPDGSQPLWGRLLPIARAIGQGETVYRLPRSPAFSDATYAAALSALANYVSAVIRVEAEDATGFEAGRLRNAEFAAEKKHFAENAANEAKVYAFLAGETSISGSLHDILNAFLKQIVLDYHDASTDTISDHGLTLQRQVESLKRLLPNQSLSLLDFDGVDKLFRTIRNRPLKPDGKPYAFKTCQHLIRALHLALQWADDTHDSDWKLPAKYHRVRRKVRRLEADEERALGVPTYTIAELVVLYRHASVRQRLLLLLALNCAHCPDQSGRLRLRHLRLQEGKASFIRSRRFKRDVEGRWRLWEHTAVLLKRVSAQRPAEATTDHVLVNRNGNQMYGKSRKGNRSRQIATKWYHLLDRVKKDHPTFRRLGISSLRDTSIDLVRKIGGEELASVHSAHIHQSADKQLRCYSNPTYRRLFRIHRRLERKLAAIWEAVPDPTVEPAIGQITLKQHETIVQLKEEGKRTLEIVERTGLSKRTVLRHLRRAGLLPTSSPSKTAARRAK